MHKAIVKIFMIWRSFKVVRGHEGQTLDLLLLLYSLGSKLCWIFIVPSYSDFRSSEAIRGSKTRFVAATLFYCLKP